MKKLIYKGIIGIAFVSVMSSCTVTIPVTVSNAPIGKKRGMSQSVVIGQTLYLNSNYGIKEAAQNGKITSAIATVDERTTSFILFQKKTLIVTAE